MNPPVWVIASVELACGVVIAAGIVVIGLLVQWHPARVERAANHLFDYGIWFCVYGVFGNGCWQ